MNGIVGDHFIGLVLLGRTRAEDILKALESLFMAKGVNLTDMRFMGFDGCNTMSGQQKGLQRRLRHISPTSIYINCRNHRLALCLKHLSKQYELLDEVDKTLLELWKLFAYSPQKLSVFKNIQDAYGEKPLTLIKASMTRWISHLDACSRVVQRFEILIDCLDSIYTETKEPSEDHVNFTHLDSKVKATTDELHQLISKFESGNYQDTEFSKCQSFFDIITDRTALAIRMRWHDELITPAGFLESTGVPFICSLIAEIVDAFHATPVLTSFGFLDPRNIPNNNADLADYGNAEVERLVQTYACGAEDTYNGHRTVVGPDFVSPVVLKDELTSFKQQLYMMKQRGIVTLDAVFQELQRDDVLRHCFPSVTQLVNYALLIPASTAVVERGFSLMNDLCTPLRNRLLQSNLEALIRLCSEGPECLNDTQLENVDIFKGDKNRKMSL